MSQKEVIEQSLNLLKEQDYVNIQGLAHGLVVRSKDLNPETISRVWVEAVLTYLINNVKTELKQVLE